LYIPVYVVTGFLDAGKTTLMNKLLNMRESRDMKMLLIQFESGEEEFQSRYHNCDVLGFSKKALEQSPKQIIEQLCRYLNAHPTDEIWVEWNGVAPFEALQSMCLHPSLYRLLRIEKVIHMADAKALEGLFRQTGGILPGQIAASDFAVLRNMRSNSAFARIKRLLRSINPGIKLYEFMQGSKIYDEVYRKRSYPVGTLCLGILFFVAFYLIIVIPFFKPSQTIFNTIVNVFLGIMLQAVPFLMIGVLISSAIQIFISRDTIERRFPKRLLPGMAAAILFGFLLPVCDCASIPIFRSLVRKGIPLPVAVTFMTATPVINPVVMLSTYYAFGGSLRIVAARVGLGIVSASLIGLCFAIRPCRFKELSGGFDGVMCSCGCYEGAEAVKTLKGRLSLFIRHSQAEFFSVGKYLMIGAFVSSVFQTVIKKAFFVESGSGLILSLLLMMAMAFLLSLCSSSDAVVARSFASRLPMGAVMGFLVFGPMIDIKNVIMLSGGFTGRFILRLTAVSFAVCFLVVFLLARPAIGG